MNTIALIIFLLYAAAVMLMGYIMKGNDKYRFPVRKFVYFGTGMLLLYLTLKVERDTLLILIILGTILSLLTYFINSFSYIHKTSDSSLGTIFYPFGILISLLILYNMPLYYFQISLLVLALSDTVANICGLIRKRNFRFALFKDEKSLLGAAGFAVTAFAIHLIFLPSSYPCLLLFALFSVIVALHMELISFKGSDNFTIPAGTAGFFFFMDSEVMDLFALIYPVLIILFAAGSYFLFRKKILTRHGSLGAYLTGIYFFLILDYRFGIPLLFFFITSVILTKLNGRKNNNAEESETRNIWQVMANSLPAMIVSLAYIFSGNEIFIYFYIALIAAVTADTWASEAGPSLTGKCFSLRSFSVEESGISGGISFHGSFAALAGAGAASVLSSFLFFSSADYSMILILTMAGFLSSFADSFLSAFLEPQLLRMRIFNRKLKQVNYSPAPNDIVNLIGSSAAVPIFIIISYAAS
jgi:uncharacterized protein (TIGR00297 family)